MSPPWASVPASPGLLLCHHQASRRPMVVGVSLWGCADIPTPSGWVPLPAPWAGCPRPHESECCPGWRGSKARLHSVHWFMGRLPTWTRADRRGSRSTCAIAAVHQRGPCPRPQHLPLLSSEVVGIYTLKAVRCHSRHTQIKVQHQLSQGFAVDQHDLAINSRYIIPCSCTEG